MRVQLTPRGVGDAGRERVGSVGGLLSTLIHSKVIKELSSRDSLVESIKSSKSPLHLSEPMSDSPPLDHTITMDPMDQSHNGSLPSSPVTHTLHNTTTKGIVSIAAGYGNKDVIHDGGFDLLNSSSTQLDSFQLDNAQMDNNQTTINDMFVNKSTTDHNFNRDKTIATSDDNHISNITNDGSGGIDADAPSDGQTDHVIRPFPRINESIVPVISYGKGLNALSPLMAVESVGEDGPSQIPNEIAASPSQLGISPLATARSQMVILPSPIGTARSAKGTPLRTRRSSTSLSPRSGSGGASISNSFMSQKEVIFYQPFLTQSYN